jgi:hypothetical protein
MIKLEVNKKDLLESRVEVRNLPGTLFAGTGPLLRPFLTKLEILLPPEERGHGSSYTFASLRTHVDKVCATSDQIDVESRGRAVGISRAELEEMIGNKYPTLEHQKLNLPGLLFLQSGPALQICCLEKLARDHGAMIPRGRRTLRYVFHTTVVSVYGDSDSILVEFELDRLPKLASSSSREDAD